MYTKFQQHLQKELADIEAAGLYKNERIIESPQGAEIMVKGKKCLNFCANNYLGLADNHRGCQEGYGRPRLWHGLRPLHLRLPGPA